MVVKVQWQLLIEGSIVILSHSCLFFIHEYCFPHLGPVGHWKLSVKCGLEQLPVHSESWVKSAMAPLMGWISAFLIETGSSSGSSMFHWINRVSPKTECSPVLILILKSECLLLFQCSVIFNFLCFFFLKNFI